MLEIKRIQIFPERILTSNYNKIWKLFKENSELSINKIRLKGHFFSDFSYESLKEYYHCLSDIDLINLKNIKSLQILDLKYLQEWNVSKAISNLNIKVHSIRLSLQDVIKFNIKTSLIPSETLQDSVRCLIVNYVSSKKLGTLEQVMNYFISVFPKLDSLKVKSQHIVINFLLSFISSTMTWNAINKLKLNELEIGKREDENCTVVKNFPRIFWYNKDSNQARVIKASKLILQFGTGKALIYSNDQVLIFRGFSYFRVTDVSFEPNEQSYLANFKKHMPKDYANFK